jgi:hypothetical protein
MQAILQALRNPRNTFAAVLFFGLLALTARNATDPDLWWHLRTGQWIVETGHVPHFDPFSFTRAGHAWVSHEWLSEIVFYQLWKYGGAAALIVFSAMVTTAGFMFLYLRCTYAGAKLPWAAAITACGAFAAAPSWGVRPQMFTITLASLLLWLIAVGEHRPRILFWIPPLFLLWLNLHAGFALGPALLLAYGGGLLLETALGNTPWHQARPNLLRVLLLLIVCLALVPLNPSGTQLYRYPFDTVRSQGMRSLISEWRSPDFHGWLYRPLLLTWLLLLTALATGLSRSAALLPFYRPSPFPHRNDHSRPIGRVIVPLLLTAFAALDAARHIPIFLLTAVPVIATALPSASPSMAFLPRRSTSSFRPLFHAAVLLLMAAFALTRWVSLARTQDVRVAQKFPEPAVAFLRAGHYPQRIFVYYDWGGYAIWKLYPVYKVFADGRADLYGDELLRQSIKTVLQLQPGWQTVLDRWQVESVLVPSTCALAQALALDPNWHVAFTDSQAIILFRTHFPRQNAAFFSYPPEAPQVIAKIPQKMFPRAVPNLRN